MVKIKETLFFTILIILCLVGCTSRYEFIEKEGYDFKYDDKITLIKKSLGEIENKYDIYKDNAFYRDMDFKLTLCPMEENDVIYDDIINNSSEEEIKADNDNFRKTYNNIFLEEDNYYIIPFYWLKNKIMIYIDKEDDNYNFKFAYSSGDYITSNHHYGPYHYVISPVLNNDHYGYILSNMSSKDDAYQIIYLLANTIDLPYQVYFHSNSNNEFNDFYFIPDNKFSKKCIQQFNEVENIHYLDLDKIREML